VTARLDEVTLALMRGTPPAELVGLYEELRSAGPAHVTRFGIVVVTSYRLGRDVLRDPAFGVSTSARMDRVWPDWRRHPVAVQLLDSVFGTDPPEHKVLRAPLWPYFSEAGVRLADGIIDRAVAAHATALRTKSPVDAIQHFARPVAVDVISGILGIPAQDVAALQHEVADWTAALELVRSPRTIEAADEAVTKIHGYVAEVIDQRRRRPDDGLVSKLANDDAFATSNALVANIAMLLAAGIETTSALLGNILHATATMQRARIGKIRGDLPGIRRFVDETLRLESPLRLASRVVLRPVSLQGHDFRAGADVFVLLDACNRDPAAFAIPDDFDWVTGAVRPHLSFGGGSHHCLGAVLARRTALRAVAEVACTDRLELASAPTRNNRFVLNGFSSLPLHAKQTPRTLTV
jgi:cytochrome P450